MFGLGTCRRPVQSNLHIRLDKVPLQPSNEINKIETGLCPILHNLNESTDKFLWRNKKTPGPPDRLRPGEGEGLCPFNPRLEKVSLVLLTPWSAY